MGAGGQRWEGDKKKQKKPRRFRLNKGGGGCGHVLPQQISVENGRATLEMWGEKKDWTKG